MLIFEFLRLIEILETLKSFFLNNSLEYSLTFFDRKILLYYYYYYYIKKCVQNISFNTQILQTIWNP